MAFNLSVTTATATTEISNPDVPQIVLDVGGIPLSNWTSYNYNSNLLVPADGWSFTLQDDSRISAALALCVPGALVTLSIQGAPQSNGFIDAVEIKQDRHSGVHVTIHGRDRLGQVVDSTADPTLKFSENTKLIDVLTQIFKPFGLDVISDSNDANRSAITKTATAETHQIASFIGQTLPFLDPLALEQTRAVLESNKDVQPLSLKGISPPGTTSNPGSSQATSYTVNIVDYLINRQFKHYPHEGLFQFVSRLLQHYGLWLWLSADGRTVVVSQPHFDQAPLFTLTRKFDGGTDNNILYGEVRYNFGEQPDVIIADCITGGAEVAHSKARAIAFNTLTAYNSDGSLTPSIQAIKNRFPDSKEIKFPRYTGHTQIISRDLLTNPPPPRVVYMHDDEAYNDEELERFVRREMSLKMRRGVEARYTVNGHGQQAEGQPYVPWCIDSIVKVYDEVTGLNENMYVLGRTFEKSRHGGTITHLDLIRVNTLYF